MHINLNAHARMLNELNGQNLCAITLMSKLVHFIISVFAVRISLIVQEVSIRLMGKPVVSVPEHSLFS